LLAIIPIELDPWTRGGRPDHPREAAAATA